MLLYQMVSIGVTNVQYVYETTISQLNQLHMLKMWLKNLFSKVIFIMVLIEILYVLVVY